MSQRIVSLRRITILMAILSAVMLARLDSAHREVDAVEQTSAVQHSPESSVSDVGIQQHPAPSVNTPVGGPNSSHYNPAHQLRFRAHPQSRLVRSERNLLLYPNVQITERPYTKGKVFSRTPLLNVRRDLKGDLTVTDLTRSAVEATLDLEAIEAFLHSDAEFISLPITDDEAALVRIDRIYDRGEHTVTLSGSIAGHDISEAMIVVHDGVIYGTLHLPQSSRVIEYAAAGNGDVAIRELNTQKDVHGSCALSGTDGHEPSSLNASLESMDSIQPSLSAPPGASDYVADFVVTYNQQAQNELGGVAATEAKVILSIDAVTEAMKNSEIDDFYAALLATALETEITINDWTAISVLLEDRKFNADGTYAYASELRDLTGADIAVYMYSGGSGSAGELNSFEFSIGSGSIASAGSNFTHEFGHCCGALHAWGDTEAVEYPYTGWRFRLGGQRYRTVMSYDSPPTIGPSARIGYFSNPNQTLTVTDGNGIVTDEAALGAPRGFDALNDPHADPSLIRGGRNATFDTNGVYVSGGYNQSGFDGTLPNLGAVNQEVVNNSRVAKASFTNRAAVSLVSSPVGSFASGDSLNFFVFAGAHYEPLQMDLYRNGAYVQTIQTATYAHAHALTWLVPGGGGGLQSGSNYQVYFTTTNGTVLQSNPFDIQLATLPPLIVVQQSGQNAAYTVSSNDLLQTSVTGTNNGLILNGPENGAAGGSTFVVLNNGVFGNGTDLAQNGKQESVVVQDGTITYTLDLSVNTLGYAITSIVTYAGWADVNRGSQAYTVSYSQVGSTNFTNLVAVAMAADGFTQERYSITENNYGILATGVDEVRFTFPTQQFSGVGYKELDVFGYAVITPSVYALWATGFLPAVIGSETNDYDGDSKNNFYEFAFNGNPTNPLVTEEAPVFMHTGDALLLIYAQRTDTTNLIYNLEARTNLTSGDWTNFAYIVQGTNNTGAAFSSVTNSIPTSDHQMFIRMKALQR